MSGNRANASAIQRRGNNTNNATRVQSSPVSQQSQYASGRQHQQQQQQIPQANPKLSVSDAIALITIRLGRVETFINNLPPLDQMEELSNNTQHVMNNDSMRIVDDAVFKSIVSRLDKIEKNNNIDSIKLNNSEIENLKNDINNLKLQTTHHSEINNLKLEINELKNLLLSLQSYTMTTNEKLCNIIFQNNNDNDSDNQSSIIVNKFDENNYLSNFNDTISQLIIDNLENSEDSTKDQEQDLSINI